MGHPEQPLSARPRQRRWLPTLAVLVVILAVSFGGFVVAGELETSVDVTEPEPSGPLVPVAMDVSLPTVAGWEESERFTDPDGVRVSRGVAHLDAYAFPAFGTPDELFEDYRANGLQPQASQLELSAAEPVLIGDGAQAIRVSYVGIFGEQGSSIEGEVTAAVTADGTGLLFDGWAPQGQLGFVVDEVRAMVEGVQHGG